MKKSAFKICVNFLYITLLGVIITSCNYTGKHRLRAEVAQNRVVVVQNALDLINRLKDGHLIEQNLQNRIDVISKQLDTIALYKANSATINLEVNNCRYTIYNYIADAYRIGINIAENISDTLDFDKINELNNIVLQLKSTEGIDQNDIILIENFETNLKLFAEKNENANDYILFAPLNSILIRNLTLDLQIINLFFNEAFVKYEEDIKAFPLFIFDEAKLKELTNEPYQDKTILVELYKLKLIDEVKASKELLTIEVNNSSRALEIFDAMNSKLLKDDFTTQDILGNIEEIDTLLHKNVKANL